MKTKQEDVVPLAVVRGGDGGAILYTGLGSSLHRLLFNPRLDAHDEQLELPAALTGITLSPDNTLTFVVVGNPQSRVCIINTQDFTLMKGVNP